MLELKNVNAGYGKKMVLSDVSVKLNDNTITVVMGPNGAGKSTKWRITTCRQSKRRHLSNGTNS